MYLCAHACILYENTDWVQTKIGLNTLQLDSLSILKLNVTLNSKVNYPLIFPNEIWRKHQEFPFDLHIQDTDLGKVILEMFLLSKRKNLILFLVKLMFLFAKIMDHEDNADWHKCSRCAADSVRNEKIWNLEGNHMIKEVRNT